MDPDSFSAGQLRVPTYLTDRRERERERERERGRERKKERERDLGSFSARRVASTPFHRRGNFTGKQIAGTIPGHVPRCRNRTLANSRLRFLPPRGGIVSPSRLDRKPAGLLVEEELRQRERRRPRFDGRQGEETRERERERERKQEARSRDAIARTAPTALAVRPLDLTKVRSA